MTATDRDDRPDIYEEGELVIYRASTAGNCFKNLVAIRMGVAPADTPAWLQKAYDEGSANEPVIMAKLVRDHGWTLDEDAAQGTVELRVGSKVVIRGHVDGVGAHREHGRRVIEAKAFAKSTYSKFKSKGFAGFPYYANQLSIYMGATGLPGAFCIGIKDDNGNVDEVVVILVDEPPVAINNLKARIMRVETTASRGEIPETCDFTVYPCSTWFLHEEDEKPEVEDLTKTKIAVKVNGLCETYLRGHNMQTRGKQMKEQAGKELKELLGEDRMNLPLMTDGFELKFHSEDVPGGTFERKAYTKSYPTIKTRQRGE